MGGSPTIKDVARYAGVSVSTVSRVINDYHNVNEETRRLVINAIKEIGYKPNALARGLRSQKTKTIALVVNNILNPFYSVMAQGIEDTARKHGFHLFLCNSGAKPDQEAAYLEALWEKRVDGLIIAPTGANISLLERYLEANIPVIQVDRKVEGLDTDVVLTDNENTARTITDHLIEVGYRKIAIIVGMQTVTTGIQRLSGYLNALGNHGLSTEPAYIKIGDFSEETGYRLMQELLLLPNRPEAVFVGNNLMARGAILAIREHQLKIPEDIAFAMFDNPDWAQLHQPPITAVEQPTYQLGVEAAELLFRRLEQGGRKRDSQVLILKNQLIVRASTDPVRR